MRPELVDARSESAAGKSDDRPQTLAIRAGFFHWTLKEFFAKDKALAVPQILIA
jgi:hypothetical protein